MTDQMTEFTLNRSEVKRARIIKTWVVGSVI